MGWGSGKGKAEVLVPAAEVAIANNDDPRHGSLDASIDQ